ncbi:DUF6233 domain-containing protein [Streptomyces sp. NPDC059695]|uniref:DUF6233 domain-containing protein n=1 Tax=Streptomyces sp. NPDC059695 TaxID=3346910 RepID=UPI003699BDF8
MWLRPQDHLRPVDGVAYDDVPTELLPQPMAVERILGPRRPSGWILARLGGRRGRGQAVVHAADCTEVPPDAPRLTLDQAVSAAERPGARLCTLCGATAELEPALRLFTEGFDDRADGDRP